MPNQEEEVILIMLIASFLMLFVLITGFVFFAFYQKRKFEYTREKQKLQTKQQQLQIEIEVQEHVFKTISQEIHDNIGQLLSLAKLTLHTTNVAQSPSTMQKIAQSTDLIGKSITALRDLSKSLNAEIIKEIGLHESITRELLLLSKSGKFKTSLVEKGLPYRLDQQKELFLFRIFQEAINNIIKHSNATTIEVLFAYETSLFQIDIKDNGVGFPIEETCIAMNGCGSGIKNMRNRANLIGAEFKLLSNVGDGTTVSLAISNQ